jgi:adenine-specific DNA-methyltransferase
MLKMTLLEELKSLLKKDDRLVSEDRLLKNKIVELTLKLDKDLIKLLLSNKKIKEHFFEEIDKILIFDKEKFMKFVDNKEFLPDSYTTFKNKIGLTADEKYLAKTKEVVLSWPYKDCVLEGGQEKEDEKRKEIFHNEILAPDEIDRLLEPKVFTKFNKFDATGERKVTEIKPNDNLIIKGNNLLALHSLKKRFTGQVKLIYIDPPYNTGSDSFGYNDNFNHSTWLTFMRNRLNAAKYLLKDEGAIFVQIDLHELGYMQVLMDEVFGRNNKVQIISVKTASPAGFKTVNPGPIDVTEYILFYTKKRKKFQFKRSYVPIEYDTNYDLFIENIQDEPKNWKLRPLRDVVYEQNGIGIGDTPQKSAKNAKQKWGEYWKIIRHQAMAKLALENGNRVVSVRDPHKPSDSLKKALIKSKEKKNKILVYSRNQDDEELNEDERKESYLYNGGALSFYSNKIVEIDGSKRPSVLLSDFWSDISWDGIAKEGGVKLKNGKKPEKLLKRIIEMATDKNKNEIVLDYHLGSGTTCAVAHKMGRQYIGIEQLDYGENDSVQRLKNVIGKENVRGKLSATIEDYDTSGISKAANWKGGGDFVYCELTELNEEFVQKIKKAKDSEELLKIWEEMKKRAFLSYRVDSKLFDDNIAEFKKLPAEEQKKLLVKCLDANNLYVNYSEIKDNQYKVSKEDIELNKKFYGGL